MLFDDFVIFCQTARYDEETLGDNPVVQDKLANLKVGMEGWELACWKVAWMQSRGEIPNAEAYVSFLFCTDKLIEFESGLRTSKTPVKPEKIAIQLNVLIFSFKIILAHECGVALFPLGLLITTAVFLGPYGP